MGARAESLAKQFETKAAEMTAVIKGLTDVDWKKTTEAEKWSVGVTAHHVAGGHEGILGIVKTLAAGQSIPNFTMDMLHEMNATHAKEQAGCTKAETLALHEKNAAAAAAAVRGLSDAELDRKGTVLAEMPAMTTQQVIEAILINHINDHMGSIRKTVGG
ncbi:MAG TPA: DinB family protein [Methylomirabilota bacterium]|nr:DinB family protein [Methylomirabilota bacterium]